MDAPSWLSFSEAVANWTTALAVIIGGTWAYYRFILQRANQTALEIELAVSSSPYRDGLFIVFFDVACRNKGTVRLVASKKRRPVFNDNAKGDGELVRHSLDIQLRQIAAGLEPYHTVDWWVQDLASQWGPLIKELDLLEDYEVPGTDRTDFWMEPSESYHLATCLVLPLGHYIAKVTFVGQGASESWRRTFHVTVPVDDSASEVTEASVLPEAPT